ncbi:restriction endonuclease subunit S [[Clostridium] polysaccharolyticum]|uniref:Type I restriction enzyme, S subunit n=1 Tax=[Clostridium] polysaccharolyticum TaxID=29364 RepID=A0A1I0CLC4_9FIRM|nr:restriction endonuclease subunit S [[Clostridium] polysaccharolyticum]SET20362.1 type I restriction enzyme, S subunit [[Clostridium] polysaccharolyticum]
MSWEEKVLGQISINIQTGPFGSQLHQSDYSEVGTPVVMPKDLINGKISEESIARVSKEHVERLSRHKIEVGDILYSRRGDVGRCAFTTEREKDWLCGTGCLRVTVDKEQANPRFVFFQLQKPETIGWVVNHAVGATMLNLNTSILNDVPITVPDIETQDKIVSILSAYDDLIENNQKQIKLLEEAAQRLYKEWFVDLHFPGYEDVKVVDGVPEGWRNVPLRNMISFDIGGGWGEENIKDNSDKPAYVIRGTDLHGITHGEMLSIPFRFHTKSNLASRMLQDGDIVFEVSGGSKTEGVARTLLIRQEMLEVYGSPVMCASFCKLVRVSELLYSQYLYDTFQYLRSSGKTTEFDKKSASSIVNYRWKDFLSQQKIFVPPSSVMEIYNSLAENYYYQVINLSKQIECLRNARDRLLPKLMSREIEV